MTKDNYGLWEFAKNILDDAEEEGEEWFDAESLHEMLIYDLIGRLMNEAHREYVRAVVTDSDIPAFIEESLKYKVCEMIEQHVRRQKREAAHSRRQKREAA